jgi:hypothetical protein
LEYVCHEHGIIRLETSADTGSFSALSRVYYWLVLDLATALAICRWLFLLTFSFALFLFDNLFHLVF